MPLFIRCPDCEADNRVAEDLKGKKVACKVCGGNFKVDTSAKFVEQTEEERRKESLSDSNDGAKKKSRRKDLDDDDDDDDRSRRRRRRDEDDRPRDRVRNRDTTRSSDSSSGGQKAGIAGGVVTVLVVIAVIGLRLYSRADRDKPNNPPPQAVVQQLQGPNAGVMPGKQEPEFDKNLRLIKEPIPNRQAVQFFNRAQVDEGKRAEVARALEKCLTIADPGISSDACDALKRWGDKDSIQPLVDSYRSRPDLFVRHRVIDALGDIKEPASAAALVGFLKEPGSDRGRITGALRRLGKIAETDVATLLSDADPRNQMDACQMLMQFGTKASVPALESLAEANKPMGKAFPSPLYRTAMQAANVVRNRP